MTEERLIQLIAGHWSGTLEPHERLELECWGAEASRNQAFLEEMSDGQAIFEREARLWNFFEPQYAYHRYLAHRFALRKRRSLRVAGWLAAVAIVHQLCRSHGCSLQSSGARRQQCERHGTGLSGRRTCPKREHVFVWPKSSALLPVVLYYRLIAVSYAITG